MVNTKLPFDAFEHYFALGVERSYRAVAEHFEVSKTAVANFAEREGWQDRVLEREEKAREALDKKAVESIEQMTGRHLRICKFVEKKALETLRSSPLSSSMDAVRALQICMRQEALVMGRPAERVPMDLPKVVTPQDAVAVSSALLEALSRGDITPQNALQVSQVVEVAVRAIEMHEIEGRIRALEAGEPPIRRLPSGGNRNGNCG